MFCGFFPFLRFFTHQIPQRSCEPFERPVSIRLVFPHLVIEFRLIELLSFISILIANRYSFNRSGVASDGCTVPPPASLPHLRPQDLLLGLPLGSHIEEVVSRLSQASTPPAPGGVAVLCPLEVLYGEAVSCL